MGLISKTAITKWGKNNKKKYIERGYVYTKYGDKFEIDIKYLPKRDTSKVDVICDNCDKEYTMGYSNYNTYVKDNGHIYCNLCSHLLYASENTRLGRLKNGTSFYQWCIDNNRKDVLDRWDYELNKYKPDEISFGSNKKCWLKCPESIHKSELKNINGFTNGQEGSIKCNGCNSIGQWLINSYGDNALNIYWSDKNTVDPFEISYGNSKKVWLKCDICGFDKEIKPSRFIRSGLGCNRCSDGISFPNKMGFNILDQLNLAFKNEYTPSWIEQRRYDFYFELNDKKYILEMDGFFHSNDNEMNGITKEESKEIDDYKDKLANEHGIEVIRIDCLKSDLEHIKENIIHSKLNDILDLSNIDWLKCEEFAISSLVKVASDMWSNGMTNTLAIADALKLERCTIIRYLNKGCKLGFCNYNGKEESKKEYIRISRKVYCVELDRHFDSIVNVGKELDMSISNISSCCSGKVKSASGYHWMYSEDYLKSQIQSA